MEREEVAPGTVVVREGESDDRFYVLLAGVLAISQRDFGARGVLRPGDYFGEVALLNESARTATITAETDLRCYGLTSWEFRPLVETHGSIAWKLLQAMSKTYQGR